MGKTLSVWRWAKPSHVFFPERNTIQSYTGQFEMIVYAGLSPEDWFDLRGRNGSILHQIDLTHEQAKLCAVAEGKISPHEDELIRFAEERGYKQIGLLKKYEDEMYPETITPLLEYEGGFEKPEVLIPFSINAKKARLKTIRIKVRRWAFSLILPFLTTFQSRRTQQISGKKCEVMLESCVEE